MTSGHHLRFGVRPSGGIFLAAAVVMGLVVPGSEAVASHVSCGDTITIDTTLDADLIDCPNNGIVIGADDITLDLNGHTIDGDNALVDPCPEDQFCDFGVINDGHNGVRIKGGAVTEFGTGVALFRARKNRLSDLSTFENIFNGILLVRSSRSRVAGSSASGNGLTTDFPGMAMIESHNNRITHNAMFRNADLGLFVAGSDRNHIGYNRMRGHREGGILLEGDGNEIVRNRLVRDGILITLVTRQGRAVGNVVGRNHVRGAPKIGIAVDSVPRGTVIRRNHVNGAGDDGFGVESSRTTLTRNVARNNHNLGINAVEGVIDGGGNRASGNGDPRQCLNVACR